MELDGLKNTWKNLTNQVEKQNNISPEFIDRITQTKYNTNMKKITYPEIIGAIICLTGACYIGMNFSKLDTAFFTGAGIVSIFLLLALPFLSILSLRHFYIKDDLNKTHTEILKNFAVQKIRFHKFQQVNITLSYLLLVTVIILLPKFFSGRNITAESNYWIFAFPTGYIFLLFFSKWVLKNYNTAFTKAEELLKDLQSVQS